MEQDYRQKNHSLKLVSFNCKSLKRSVNSVRGLCGSADVVALQETWLMPYELAYLSTVHDKFESTGTSAVDTGGGMLRGRPHGGVALLWRKNVFTSVSVVKCNNVRLCAIRCQFREQAILYFSVYMPVDCFENLTDFTDCMSEINAIIEDSGIEVAFILGDFNAHPGELFFNEMCRFCEDQKWVCADYELLSSCTNVYTYMSDSHGCTRWLDHCLVTRLARNYVDSVNIKNDVTWSDHYPMEIYCRFSLDRSRLQPTEFLATNKVIWGKRDSEQIHLYTDYCNNKLMLLNCPYELIDCCNKLCDNSEHKKAIKNMYDNIVGILRDAAIYCYKSAPCKNKRSITGWNKHVAPLHARARYCFQSWIRAGRPTHGAIYEDMRDSRRAFKIKLKWCQDNEEQIKMDILATSYKNKHFGKFWQQTNRLNARPSLPADVGGISGCRNIANMFKTQFKVNPCEINCTVAGSGDIINNRECLRFTTSEVVDTIMSMKRGKSPGHDGLSVEHLRHAGVHLPRVLGMLYNLCIGHGFLPDAMTMTVVVPVIKNRTGDAADRTNYRPISLATITAKVLDGLLDTQLSKSVNIHDAQFGFRPELSTESAILCLKQAVRYYTDRKTHVFACFLDLSKAFDLVSYNILWQKLETETYLRPELISLLKYWYGVQSNVVRWGNALSDPYKLECGVRQGGLTSPRLFNLYMNKLIERLNRAGVGCSIDGVVMNNFSYADDMVLLSPSVSGLRKLINICEEYAKENGLRYNAKKSEILIFRGKNKPLNFNPNIHLCGTPLKQVSEFKYLGHIVNERLDDDSDIERERRALSVRGNMLARRFARCTLQVKVILFKAFCQSFYTCSLWENYTQRAYSALRVQYNNVLRVLLKKPRHCSASAMFAEARIDDFYAIIRKRTASAMHRLMNSSNNLLSTLAVKLDGPLWRRWDGAHVAVRHAYNK